jgi:gluconolactonase
MKSASWALVSCVLAAAVTAADARGQAGQAQPTPEPPETVAPNIPGVVAGGTRVQFLKGNLQGTEGPIAAPDGSFLFTETGASRITKIDKADQFSTYMENTNGSNGLAFDAKGRLITVQTVKPLVGVLSPANTVLADRFEGKSFGRPNDLVVDKRGGVYFTDPGPNVAAGQQPATPPLPPAVYYIPPGGQVLKIADGIARPNGIQLSPDERVLYVANTNGEHVIAFDLKPDGSAGNRRDFARLEGVEKTPTGVTSGADGLAVDSQGRLYVASRVGVQVFSPQGQHLGTIPIPRPPQNIAFAGADKKTLYVVGRGSAYKIAMQAEGVKGRAK